MKTNNKDFDFMKMEELIFWIKENNNELKDELDNFFNQFSHEELLEICIDIFNYNMAQERKIEQLVIEQNRDK